MVQLGLYTLGFYRVTADGSARSRLALRLYWHNALNPWVWPPFYKIFVVLFLKLHGDVVIVPRILVGMACLAMLLILLQFADTRESGRRAAYLSGGRQVPLHDCRPIGIGSTRLGLGN